MGCTTSKPDQIKATVDVYRPAPTSFAVFDINAIQEPWLMIDHKPQEHQEKEDKPSHVPVPILEKLHTLEKSDSPLSWDEVSKSVLSDLKPKPEPNTKPVSTSAKAEPTPPNKNAPRKSMSFHTVEELDAKAKKKLITPNKPAELRKTESMRAESTRTEWTQTESVSLRSVKENIFVVRDRMERGREGKVASFNKWDPLSEFPEKCPKNGGADSVVLYTTSLRGVRRTYEECNRARTIFETHRVVFDERDVSLHSDSLTLSLLTLLLLLISTLSWYSWKKQRTSLLLLPPGPRGVPLLGNLLYLDPELHSYFAGLAQIHGPIFKLRLGYKLGIVVTSPSLTREVLRDHDVTFANRDAPEAARVATYGGSDIVWTPYGPEWRMLRKVCVIKMLSNTTLDSVYELRRKQVRETVGYFYRRVGSPVNIGEQMFLTVMNVITNMMWGGTVEGQERSSLGADFREVVSEMTELLGKPNISDFYPGLARFDLQGIKKQMDGLAKRFDRIFDVMINQRLKIDKEGGSKDRDKDSKDFLQFLLKLKDEGDSKTPMTMIHLKALLMDMVVGGTDTSSNTIEFAMAEIMNKPEVMRKTQQELEAVVGKDNIVEESHIHKLPYLHAVMKEALRLHPALPLLVPHCPSETCTVGGYTIPKGSRIFVNVWAIQRDPSIWENPLNFDPERFLNTKWDYNGNDFNYFPFGSGRRICAGTAMAERMVIYSLATLLHSFDWNLPQGEKLDITEKFGIVLKKKIPLVAVPTPRLSDPSMYE